MYKIIIRQGTFGRWWCALSPAARMLGGVETQAWLFLLEQGLFTAVSQ